MYNYANENISAVVTLWLDQSDVDKFANEQQERFEKASKVGGSSSHHCFERSDNILIARRTSTGDVSLRVKFYDVENPISKSVVDIATFRAGTHVAYIYEGNWYAGAILDVEMDENDIKVNSLHPNGPAKAFKFPERVDELWVPAQNIIRQICLTTENHRQYNLTQSIQDEIEQQVCL